MLYLNMEKMGGLKFKSRLDRKPEWTIVGYGEHPVSGAMHIVGICYDDTTNTTLITTFLFKDITIIGHIIPD